ncbi:hypothetical protein A2303_00120 [Candidatus Falkowbacteria bacterium RIFOXYB2_FULL_47_14]|uniref:Uncharacterized protein n=1 Tax=Candidatus Falkowbacteria bacterium RIFOXYA2_FULL_47_19 TaxID=1797994 RepID=A0A1F5SN31_9BACT|nr:MAG: hypothetical protein A2227_01400 [Candidatus Falkowbacteria bacterium RIFOXYA2_FULL_47_19]OGF36814.1 MAG: hypothetical protein A2468_03365 [Candidatus Falkowbacteria bacterium RIFOXYC2_FULL_46_15]OGF44060.1 MAG: hypothetical protein A2303_00120 [Candidatus Falkowbacteria bacterium RIFOXYB2_FULL_47_14]
MNQAVNSNASLLGLVRKVVWEIIFSALFGYGTFWLWGLAGAERIPFFRGLLYIASVVCGIITFFILWDMILQTKYDAMAIYSVNPTTGRITITTFGFPRSKDVKTIKYDRILDVDGGRRMFLNAGNIELRYVTFLNTEPETKSVTLYWLTDPVPTVNALSKLIEKDPAMEVTVKQ